MTRKRAAAALACAAAVAVGARESPVPLPPTVPGVIAADLHVHATPGDGALPVWEIQREAARRSLSAIVITNHDDRLALRLARASGLLRAYPLVLDGQEVTARDFHIIAVGVRTVVDSAQPARQVIEAIHAQGGVALAAHPTRQSWRVSDPEALTALDGLEVLHPLILGRAAWEREMQESFSQAQQLKPHIAPIGSTDFHVAAPLGLCRTYLIVDELSEAGILAAIRAGRTVASGPADRLVGAPEHVAAVRAFVRPPARPGLLGPASAPALLALAALAVFVATEETRTD
jgi:hypothetical protein